MLSNRINRPPQSPRHPTSLFTHTQNPMSGRSLERRLPMKICTLFLLLHFLSCATTRAAGECVAKPSLETLAWLAGNWSFEQGGRTITEQWMAPDGGTMLGMSRTVAKGKTVEYEFLLLRQDDQGNIAYVAKPSGQPETSFTIVRASATEATFEDPKHDYLRRVSDTFKSDGSLLAAIEGSKDGKFRRIEFPYRRAKPDKTSRAGGHPAISLTTQREGGCAVTPPPSLWTTAFYPFLEREHL